MNKLYHYPLCPLSRQIRVLLEEIGIPFTLIQENYWQKKPEFYKVNPANTVPVLDKSGEMIIGVYPITEYLNEKYQANHLITPEIQTRCEVRRLLDWFNNKFYFEVTRIIINEKVIRRYLSNNAPRIDLIRLAKSNLKEHIKYISLLFEKRSFIATETLSYADIAAASHISSLDYFGEINWDLFPLLKQWYSILKSRPAFRKILQDKIAGFAPATNYLDLDF